MARSKPLVLIVGLAALFVLLAILFARPARGHDPIRDHSATRTNPWGTKALAEVCQKHGLKTAYYQSGLSDLSGKQQFLCLFDPTRPLDDEGLQDLLGWVHRGGRLLVAVDLDESHQLSLERRQVTPDQALLSALGLAGHRGLDAATTITVAENQQFPELRDVRSLYVPSGFRLRQVSKTGLAPLRWQHLFADRSGDLLLSARYGRGQIWALSEVEMLSNVNLARADNVVLAANLLFGPRVATVHFDEAVHLVRQGLSDEAQQLDPSRALAAFFAVMVALGLYLVSRGWRFGAPVPLRDTPRRSALEFVNAFADLYRRAGAREATLELLGHSFRRRLAALAGVSADLPAVALAAAVASRRHVPEAPLAQLLQELQPPQAGPTLTDEELFALTRQMARTEEALDHVRRSH